MFTLAETAGSFGKVLRDATFDRTDFVAAREGRAACYAADRKHLALALENPFVAAVIVPPDLAADIPAPFGVLAAEDANLAFRRLHVLLAERHGMGVNLDHHVDPSARIDPAAHVEQGCRIGPGAVVEAGAILHAGTVLEAGAIVRSAAVVGADGRFERRAPGDVLRAPHVGGVRVGEEAEIGAGALVQRAIFPDFTEIGARSTLTSGAFVAHGVRIGEDVVVAMRASISGYTTIGDRAWIGSNSTVSNLIHIGADARVEIGAVVVRSLPPGARYSGLFARPHGVMREMSKRLRALVRDGGDDA